MGGATRSDPPYLLLLYNNFVFTAYLLIGIPMILLLYLLKIAGAQ
jgi:hypothetical protein